MKNVRVQYLGYHVKNGYMLCPENASSDLGSHTRKVHYSPVTWWISFLSFISFGKYLQGTCSFFCNCFIQVSIPQDEGVGSPGAGRKGHLQALFPCYLSHWHLLCSVSLLMLFLLLWRRHLMSHLIQPNYPNLGCCLLGEPASYLETAGKGSGALPRDSALHSCHQSCHLSFVLALHGVWEQEDRLDGSKWHLQTWLVHHIFQRLCEQHPCQSKLLERSQRPSPSLWKGAEPQ